MNITYLAEQFYQYSLHIRGYTPATIRRYKYVISYYQKFCKVESIHQVTQENVRDLFYYGRINRKWKTTTFILFHTTLSVFFQWCIKEGYLSNNPIPGIEIPKKEKVLPKNLSLKEALFLLEVIRNYPHYSEFLRYRNYAIFSTFVYAGLRKQELLNLTLSDVSIENLSIYVNQGKGNKDRIIPMSYSLAQSLKRYLAERNKVKTYSPYFFISSTYHGQFTPVGLKLLTEQVQKASGIKFTVHKLRHTFATLMLEGGCDIYSLSRMMGHSDIKTTTIYLSASVEHLRSQITKHPLNRL